MRNAFTARIPAIASTKWTISRAEWVRIARYSTLERFWNHTVSATQGISISSMTRPVTGSMVTISTIVNTIDSDAPTMTFTPESSSSRSASMSEVCRETIRPEV